MSESETQLGKDFGGRVIVRMVPGEKLVYVESVEGVVDDGPA